MQRQGPPRSPSPSPGSGGLGAGAGGINHGGSAPTDCPAYPPVAARPHTPRGVVPYALADKPGPGPVGPAGYPSPSPPAGPMDAPAPGPGRDGPPAGGMRGLAPPPPETRMGSSAYRQLTIEVSGLSPETMTTTAVPDALRAHLGSAK